MWIPLKVSCCRSLENALFKSKASTALRALKAHWANLIAAGNAHSELKRLHRGAHCETFHSGSGACGKKIECLRQIERARNRRELSGRTGWWVGGLGNEDKRDRSHNSGDRICPASILLHRSVRKQVPEEQPRRRKYPR